MRSAVYARRNSCEGAMMSVALLVAGLGSALADPPWWVNALAYQVYPVSFKDTNDDGYGDIKGITQKIGYLKSLGVSTVWLSPIYKSPNYDWGYDISDFRNINSLYGSMRDFRELMEELRREGMYLIMDFVPNHTSDQHVWFKKSVRREDPFTDYYVWRNASGVDHQGHPLPPNNWVDRGSKGSCWEWNEERQQFYLHQYLVQQPDLNFRNPKVADAITDVMRFWLEVGVDGFRVDSAPFLFEDRELHDEDVFDDDGTKLPWWGINHRHTQNNPDTYKYLMQWGDIFQDLMQKDGRQRVMFLEVYADIKTTMTYYLGDANPQFMLPFNFELIVKLDQSSRAEDFKRVITSWLSNMPAGGVASWVLGNHDRSRVATRMGKSFSDALNMVASVLPGVRFLYQSEELAMEDSFVTFEDARDGFGKSSGPERYLQEGRDMARTPMQWDSTVSAGFSKNVTTWLPVSPDYWEVNVEAQQKAARSHLKVIQGLARARESPTLKLGNTTVLALDMSVLVIIRELEGHDRYMLLVNTGSFQSAVPLSQVAVRPADTALISVASLNYPAHPRTFLNLNGESTIKLRPKAAVLLRILADPQDNPAEAPGSGAV